jgi:hypothetical protein
MMTCSIHRLWLCVLRRFIDARVEPGMTVECAGAWEILSCREALFQRLSDGHRKLADAVDLAFELVAGDGRGDA